MKTPMQLFLSLTLLFLFSACNDYTDIGPVGPRGPIGPQGPEGIPGESGFVFEYTDINFFGPGYEVFLPFPEDFETFASDVALVYFLWGVEEIEGEVIDIWRPLPQQIFIDDGLLQYNFDFARFDIRLFLDATFPLDLLTGIDTDDWIARVVIVPGEFWDGGRVDHTNYHEVVEALGVQEKNILRNITTRRE